MTEKNNDLLKGLFIGGLLGIALGILFAPKSGKETRDDLTRKTNDLLAKAKDEYEKIAEKGKQVYEESLQYLNRSSTETEGTVENKAGELAHNGTEEIENSENRFKKAIDAGLEAYREETGKEKA